MQFSSILKMYAKELFITAITIALVIIAWANLFFHIKLNANSSTIADVDHQIEDLVKQSLEVSSSVIEYMVEK